MKRKPSRTKVKADAYEQPYFSQNAPMEVMDSGYRPDPQVHSTDSDPEGKLPKPPAPDAASAPAPEKKPEDRNAVLTSPLPLVVSAPEAIEKMEALNDLIKEGRPDLAQAAEAVDQALQGLEQKALGDAFVQHEVAEGEVPAAPAQNFVVGDRVVIALEDGEYQGEIQVVNGDGTYDVKTDNMATFRRVPGQSIAKPEMLQPIAPKASKMKANVRKGDKKFDFRINPVSDTEYELISNADDSLVGTYGSYKEAEGAAEGTVEPMPKARIERIKPKASKKVKADMMEKFVYGPMDGAEVEQANGESFTLPWFPEDQKKFGDISVEAIASMTGEDPSDLVKVTKVNGFFGRYSAPGYMDATDWVFGKTQEECEAELEANYGLDDDTVEGSQKIRALKEGYKLIEGVHVVEEGGKPRAFTQEDNTVPAELYVNPEGKLALVGPDGEVNYEESANDDVEFDYWKQVHALVPQQAAAKPEAKPAAAEPAKEPVAAKKRTKASKKPEPTPAEKLLTKHKVTAAEFWVVEKAQGVQMSDAGRLNQALVAGLKPEAVLGIFADKGAAERFAKIVLGGKEGALNEINEADLRLMDAETAATDAKNAVKKNKFKKAEGDASSAQDLADGASEDLGRALNEIRDAVEGSKVIARGKASDLMKDDTYAAVIDAAKVKADQMVVVLASKDGVLSVKADMKEEVGQELRELAKTGHRGAEAALLMLADGQFDQEIADNDNMGVSELVDLLVDLSMVASKKPDAPAASTSPAVEASAFDQIPELEIGGGYKARRKKDGKAKEGEEPVEEIEVLDKDGKVVETYPDAFGDDTVMIIKFLRKVMDITETDDKKAGKAEAKEAKEEKVDKAEDKPKALPDAEPKKDKDSESKKDTEKDKDSEELKARAAWMERRVEDCREVVTAMLRKGHVVASQDDIDSELLKGNTLRQAQEVAARKAVDREVMRLLAKPEAELQIIKASLPHLAVRQMKVQASVGGLELTHLSASGLIHDEATGRGSNLGLAVSVLGRR